MARNRVRDQYKNIAVLLRRLVHVDCDYDVFVIVEESVEAARYKAAFNARKFFEATEENLVSWQDWLQNDKTKAIVLGYSSKAEGIVYKGYNDFENQPLSNIEKNLKYLKEEKDGI
jgi:hypothetical protein